MGLVQSSVRMVQSRRISGVPQDGSKEGPSRTLHIYTDSESYAPGDTVQVMAISTGFPTQARLVLLWDGPTGEEVIHETPPLAVGGCWPLVTSFNIPRTWASHLCRGPGPYPWNNGTYIVRGFAVPIFADSSKAGMIGEPGAILGEHSFSLTGSD